MVTAPVGIGPRPGRGKGMQYLVIGAVGVDAEQDAKRRQ